jgi:hypothetical protein
MHLWIEKWGFGGEEWHDPAIRWAVGLAVDAIFDFMFAAGCTLLLLSWQAGMATTPTSPIGFFFLVI